MVRRPVFPSHVPAPLVRYSVCTAVLLLLSCVPALAQYTPSGTSGSTPVALEPGAPAGSYPLSGFENVELFGGGLGFHLPLLDIGGRGQAGYTMTLAINTKWSIQKSIDHEDCTSQPCTVVYRHDPTISPAYDVEPGLSPGTMVERFAGQNPLAGSGNTYYETTLTRFTFKAPDGTEYEFRDAATNGAFIDSLSETAPRSRGTVFVTADGSSATFISDAPVIDPDILPLPPGEVNLTPSGNIYFRDGMRYQIVNGRVTLIEDRNGNVVTISYPDATSMVVTDSLGRTISTSQSTNSSGDTITTTISFPGFGGQPRTIKIIQTALGNQNANDNNPLLRTGFTLQRFSDLFPGLDTAITSPPVIPNNNTFNPLVTSQVFLPDGRFYEFQYNSYAELSAVTLPTGGRIEYDYVPAAGVYGVISLGEGPAMNDTRDGVYRRLSERRVYSDGTTLEGTTDYTATLTGNAIDPSTNEDVAVDHFDPSGNLLAHEVHSFYGSPYTSLSKGSVSYPAWREGREFMTQLMDVNGMTVLGPLTQVEYTFMNREHVNWWTQGNDSEPPNDPRVTDKYTTWMDVTPTLQSHEHLDYDDFNNVTDDTVYDFPNSPSFLHGAGGFLLRETATTYVSDSAYVGDTSGVHIRNLPATVTVKDANGNPVSSVTYTYDAYPGTPPALASEPSVHGHDSSYTTTFLTRGNPTSITKGLGADAATTTMQYDLYGNVVSSIDPIGSAATDPQIISNHTTMVEYSSALECAFPTKVTGPPPDFSGVTGSSNGFVTMTDYDLSTGKVKSFTDANGQSTTAEYDDPLDRLTSVSRPDHGSTGYAYNDTIGSLSVTTTTDQSPDPSIVTAQLFDGLGRVIGSQTNEGSGMILTSRSYDGMGRVAQVSNPYRTGETPIYTVTSYDALSRVKTVTGTDGTAVNTYYAGDQVLVIDQAGKERMSQSDALGRLTDVWEITVQNSGVPDTLLALALSTEGVTFPGRSEVANAYHTVYQYDALGDLISVAQGPYIPGIPGNPPPRLQSRSFTYDSLKRLLTARNPESFTITYQYDPNGNLMTKTDQRSPAVMVTYTYDNLNRLTKRTYSDGTPEVDYTYDGLGISNPQNAIGRLATMHSTVNGNLYQSDYNSYDVMGRVASYTQTTDGQSYNSSYGYDLNGNLTSEGYPSGRTVKTQYDEVGRLSNLSSGSTTYESGFSYAPFGGVLSVTLGNKLVESSTFNTRLQPTEMNLSPTSGSSLFDLTYGYTASSSGPFDNGSNNGNVREETLNVTSSNTWDQKYTYDPLNRIASAAETYNGGAQTDWARNFQYDCFGNMWVTPPTQGYGIGVNPLTPQDQNAYEPNNQLIWGSFSGALTNYDGAGNLIEDQTGNTYHYNGDNLMTSCTVKNATSGSVLSSSYTYDGDGHRITKSVTGEPDTTFVYDAFGKLIAEYGGPTPTGSGTSYLTKDHLGSTRVVTNQDGTVVSRYDYLPFGEEISGQGLMATHRSGTVAGYGASDDTRQKFTGKERDSESNFDWFGARYYSSSSSRFTTVDPSRRSAQLLDPRSWNRYSYCLGNPFGLIDTNGRWPTKIHELIVDRAFPGLTNSERAAIKAGSWSVDNPLNGGQNAANSYQHWMRAPGESVEKASGEARQFIQENEREARRLQAAALTVGKAGLDLDSLKAFGREFHTISDGTSPAHEGFQEWPGFPMNASELRYERGHAAREAEIDSYHLGLAVGATIKAYARTYGDDYLKTASGGITYGGENDPSIRAIESQFASDPSKEGEELYLYRRGLSDGVARYWGTLGQHQQ